MPVAPPGCDHDTCHQTFPCVPWGEIRLLSQAFHVPGLVLAIPEHRECSHSERAQAGGETDTSQGPETAGSWALHQTGAPMGPEKREDFRRGGIMGGGYLERRCGAQLSFYISYTLKMALWVRAVVLSPLNPICKPRSAK